MHFTLKRMLKGTVDFKERWPCGPDLSKPPWESRSGSQIWRKSGNRSMRGTPHEGDSLKLKRPRASLREKQSHMDNQQGNRGPQSYSHKKWNSANILNGLGGRFFHSQASIWEHGPATTWISASETLRKEPYPGAPGSPSAELWLNQWEHSKVARWWLSARQKSKWLQQPHTQPHSWNEYSSGISHTDVTPTGILSVSLPTRLPSSPV